MTSYRGRLCFVIGILAWTALLPPREACAFQATAGGQVQGKVILDSDGAAVSGVTITLAQVSATPRANSMNPPNSGTVTTTPISGGTAGAAATATATSAKDGSFSVSGLATGQFAVCVKDPNAAVIDPCLWTDSRTTVAVTAGTLSSGLLVRVKKASTVTVRVNDTAQALAQKSTELYPPHVLVGAFDVRGGFHPAREVRKDATGISYQLPGDRFECIAACARVHVDLCPAIQPNADERVLV